MKRVLCSYIFVTSQLNSWTNVLIASHSTLSSLSTVRIMAVVTRIQNEMNKEFTVQKVRTFVIVCSYATLKIKLMTLKPDQTSSNISISLCYHS